MACSLVSATFCSHCFQLFFRPPYRVGRCFLNSLNINPNVLWPLFLFLPSETVAYLDTAEIHTVTFHTLPHQVQGAPWTRFSKFLFLWLTSDSRSRGLFWEHSDNQAKRKFRTTLGAKLLGSEMNWATQGKCWECYCLRCLKLSRSEIAGSSPVLGKWTYWWRWWVFLVSDSFYLLL